MSLSNKEIIRKLAIDYYLKNKVTQQEISKIFKISNSTFIRWLTPGCHKSGIPDL